MPYLWPQRLKNHSLWGCTYLYSSYKGVPPPPGPGGFYTLSRTVVCSLEFTPGLESSFYPWSAACILHWPGLANFPLLAIIVTESWCSSYVMMPFVDICRVWIFFFLFSSTKLFKDNIINEKIWLYLFIFI